MKYPYSINRFQKARHNYCFIIFRVIINITIDFALHSQSRRTADLVFSAQGWVSIIIIMIWFQSVLEFLHTFNLACNIVLFPSRSFALVELKCNDASAQLKALHFWICPHSERLRWHSTTPQRRYKLAGFALCSSVAEREKTRAELQQQHQQPAVVSSQTSSAAVTCSGFSSQRHPPPLSTSPQSVT